MLLPLILCLLLSSVHTTNAASAPEMTAADTGAFLDGLLPMQLQREDIAGAVVVVVKDGSILFAKGYGYADYVSRKPVSVENTLFRPGSISKLFAWTSILQLVEQGKLDLDRNVNAYLDFKIPDTYPRAITLRNILTHTSGFEETAKDLFVAKADDIIPLGVYLKNHIPDRIFPAGSTPAYSNYATALAGYIVERVEGKPFEKYVEDSIFRPLGMAHSTFAQPLSRELQQLMSNGYKQGSEEAQPFEFVVAYPAGSLSVSGADMARFLIAHLQDGRLEDQMILRPETVRMMHARQLTLDPMTNGMAFGFYEESRNGLRIIGHGGDTFWFHSDLHLIPEHRLGLFISYNSAGKGEISPRAAVWEKFLDRYFPYPPPVASKVSVSSAKAVSGHYLTSRRGEGNILHLLWLLDELFVAHRKDDTLEIAAFKDFNGKPKRWREISPFVYQEVNGQETIVFQQKRRPLRLITRFPIFVFDKVSWYRSSHFLLILGGFTLTVLFLTLLLWSIGAAVRRHYGRKLNLSSQDRRLRLATRLICTVDLIFLLGLAGFIVQGTENLAVLTTRSDVWIRLLQVVGAAGAVGTLVVLYGCYCTWSNRERRFWTKVQETLIGIACIGFLWLVLQGHLLDFSLRY